MTLTKKEIDILAQVVIGASNKEIGVKLDDTEANMQRIRSRIYRKLGAKNAPHAVALAIKQNLI